MSKKILFWGLVFFFTVFCCGVTAQLPSREEKMKEAIDCASGENCPFGVLEFLHWNHDWNRYKYSSPRQFKNAIRLMKEAGMAWVRMDFLWDEIEPKQGEFDFAKYDNIVDLLKKNNLNVLGILDYSAPWAASCKSWNCPPKDNKLFADYAAATIKHFKGRIKYWEVWNEPDSPTYWSEQDGMKGYCELLKEVYIAAKKADPDCKILNGGLAQGLSSVNHLYDNGAKGYFDILNIHYFETPLNPHTIKGVAAYPRLAYKIMSRNGDADKKIWITEIGCPGVRKLLRVKSWWLGKNPNERQQAEWLKQVFTQLAEDKHVEKVFWAFFRDCKKNWNNGIDYLGLVRWDFSRKPSFKAYKECVNKWRKVQQD